MSNAPLLHALKLCSAAAASHNVCCIIYYQGDVYSMLAASCAANAMSSVREYHNTTYALGAYTIFSTCMLKDELSITVVATALPFHKGGCMC